MRVCAFAKLTGRPCGDKFSKLVLCERDNVIRCLKECMPGCVMYRARDVRQVKERAVGGSQTAVRYNPVGANTSSTVYKDGCGAPCGGTATK